MAKKIVEKIRKCFLECSWYRIKGSWRRYNRRHSQMNNRLKHQFTSACSFIQNTVELRAKQTIIRFFGDKFLNLNLLLKVRRFVTRVMFIQEHLQSHHKNNKIRMELLQIQFKQEFGKYQMKLLMKSKMDLEKKLRAV